MFLLVAIYLVASDFIAEKKPKDEILIFPRGHKALKNARSDEELESGSGRNIIVEKADPGDLAMIERQTAIFQWKDVCFDVKIGKENCRILDKVDGWVKPGTLTALMVVSGAGRPRSWMCWLRVPPSGLCLEKCLSMAIRAMALFSVRPATLNNKICI